MVLHSEYGRQMWRPHDEILGSFNLKKLGQKMNILIL
jgi:hypothetical protein